MLPCQCFQRKSVADGRNINDEKVNQAAMMRIDYARVKNRLDHALP